MNQQQAQALANALNGLGQLLPGLVNQVQQLQQQVQAGVAAAPLQQPLPLIFHRSPLGSGPSSDPTDCSAKEGKKFHSMATLPLFGNNQTFDVEPSKFRTFVTKLAARCKDLGCMATGGLCMVPPDAAHPLQGVPINSVEDFGRVKLDQIRAWETTFVAAAAGPLGRLAQNSKVSFDALVNSLSTSGLARIEIWRHQCHIVIQGVVCESGGCLLKVIVRESHLDSNATVSAIRLQLSSLDEHVSQNGNDIVEFNSHVRSLMDGLAACGETTQDLLVNLFKGCKMCTDADFLSCITGLENQHEDGTSLLTSDLLVERTSNFCKKHLISTTNKWEECQNPSQELLAMQAQLDKLQKGVQEPSSAKQSTDDDASQDKQDGGGGTKKPPKQPHQGKPGWLVSNDCPKKLHDVRSWGGTDWHWCDKAAGGKCDGMWAAHDPKDCLALRTKKSKNPSSGKEKKQAAKKALQAKLALLEADSSDSDE